VFSWIALGVLLAPLLLICSRVVLSGTPDLAVEGDLAMLDISTRNLSEGRSLLGPYSRFGFNHPGPAHLILRMPLFLITGGSGSAPYITVPLIIAVCLTAAFILVRRQCGYTVSMVFCLLTLLYLVQTSPVVWLRDWNPFVIIFPFLLFVLACAAVASGRPGWFPAAVICGSMVAQTHLGGGHPSSLPCLFSHFRCAGFSALPCQEGQAGCQDPLRWGWFLALRSGFPFLFRNLLRVMGT
jgi:hypothetical protein